MIDLQEIRQNPEKIKKIINSGRSDSSKADLDKWLELDSQRSKIIQKRDELREQRNELSKGLKGKPDQATIEKVKGLKTEIDELEKQLNEIEKEWQEILDWIPNIPLEEVPEGKGEGENVEFKAWEPGNGYLGEDKLEGETGSAKDMSEYGSHQDKDFTPKPHWEIGEELGLMNLEAGSKASGSRFYYLTGDGVLLVEAVFQLLWKKLLQEGFKPIYVPLLVREHVLYGSSHFPGDADQVYELKGDYVEDKNKLYLIGSSEPSNFAMYADSIIEDKDMPIKIMARSTCFRSEAGSWGKDVRGIKRTHQFEKIEMNIISKNDIEESRKHHEYLLSLNEWLLQELEIPYHVINMCIGDLGYYAAAKKYDIEFWTPSQNTYTELMSDSITTDYQSRRLGIKYRTEDGKTEYAHTLNDTGVTHRVLIAIIEHYQQSDGSLKIPKALQEYMGKEVIKK